MDVGKDKRFVVITGANSGIGLATVKQILQSGKYEVIATCRPGQRIELSNTAFIQIEMDLLSQESVSDAARKIIEITNGKIYALFNNAGYGLQLAMEDVSVESLNAQMQVNFINPIHLTNLLLPYIIKEKNSKLIFNSSVLGFFTIPFRGPYCASKFALEAAANCYRMELQNTLTSVVIIEPGPVKANFKANALLHLEANKPSVEKSRLNYDSLISRLKRQYKDSITSSDDVAKLVVKVLDLERPKIRYRISINTKISFVLSYLPYKIKDFLASKMENISVKN